MAHSWQITKMTGWIRSAVREGSHRLSDTSTSKNKRSKVTLSQELQGPESAHFTYSCDRGEETGLQHGVAMMLPPSPPTRIHSTFHVSMYLRPHITWPCGVPEFLSPFLVVALVFH